VERADELLGRAMIEALHSLLPWLRPAVTIPSMDGALRPNRKLDEAALLTECPGADNLLWRDDHCLFSSGGRLLRLAGLRDSNGPELVRTFDSEITALAGAPDGGLAVGLDGVGIVIVGGAHDGRTLANPGTGRNGDRPMAPTALCFADSGTLLACVGSQVNEPGAWQHDLLERRRSGSLWRLALDGGEPACLATQLGFPNGLLLRGDGAVAVSEAWRHRVLEFPIAARGAPQVLLDDLPGYPGRLAPAADGGAWLTVFAPRSQLVELILREHRYRRTMMQTIEPAHWIAPSLRAGVSYKEPMQGGAVKTLGIYKPWAPTRSYGLVVRLDRDFIPTASLHSRADGRRHGVTACVEIGAGAGGGGGLIVACRGDSAVVRADLPQAPEA
jgi:hypothetical protein